MSRTGSGAHVSFTRVLHVAMIAAVVAVMIPLGVPAATAQEYTADTYWVDVLTGDDDDDGLTEATAFLTITHAALVADPLDTIMVKPGIYSGASGESFPIPFMGETLISTGGSAVTTIQGSGSQELLAFTQWDDGDSLIGFTIRGGGTPAVAAVEVQLSEPTEAGTAPMIEGCVFTDNHGGNLGGALFVYASPLTDLMIERNTFTGNSATYGGAIMASEYGALYVGSNTLSNNVATTSGGALYQYTGSGGYVLLEQNTMTANTASSGGAIFWQSGTPTAQLLHGNMITSNVATTGGALYLYQVTLNLDANECGANAASAGGQAGFAYLEGSTVSARNNYLAQNSASGSGAVWTVDLASTFSEVNDTVVGNSGSQWATYASPAASMEIVNCIYENAGAEGTIYEVANADSIWHSFSRDDLATLTAPTHDNVVGAGMVYGVEPGFDVPPNLAGTSPCIDAGDAATYAPFDLHGTPRPQGPAPDIGCYELPQATPLSVYRFYRPSTGTHFYTADESEMLNVRNTLGAIYSFEGVSYTLNPENNDAWLYRFFRPSTGTHFYTADYHEMMNTRHLLGAIYTYEGISYNVSADNGGGTKDAVYRFFKPSSGTHFYTADPTERDNVIAHLSHVYQYEGPAFWVGH